jgi:hypothetical protein
VDPLTGPVPSADLSPVAWSRQPQLQSHTLRGVIRRPARGAPEPCRVADGHCAVVQVRGTGGVEAVELFALASSNAEVYARRLLGSLMFRHPDTNCRRGPSSGRWRTLRCPGRHRPGSRGGGWIGRVLRDLPATSRRGNYSRSNASQRTRQRHSPWGHHSRYQNGYGDAPFWYREWCPVSPDSTPLTDGRHAWTLRAQRSGPA